MCLNNPKGPFIAEEDIICYKNITERISKKELAKIMGDLTIVNFSGIIYGKQVSGLIVKDNEEFYFLQNEFDGHKSDLFYTFNHTYSYSWKLDEQVTLLNVVLPDSQVISVRNEYVTPYLNSIVEIGNLYESEIKFGGYYDTISYCDIISIALHSFFDIDSCNNEEIKVKCIIPKGTTYYKGRFYSNVDNCYASNQLQYIEIIQ